MNIEQKPLFRRTYKKLYASELPAVNAAIRTITADPAIGEAKKGDLAGVRVHKFDIQHQQYLLTYETNATTITLLALAVHENVYRDLKK